MSKDVDRNWDIDDSKINWSVVITQDIWSMLWANNNDAESEIEKYLLQQLRQGVNKIKCLAIKISIISIVEK